MQAVLKQTAAAGFVIADTAPPSPGPGEVLLRVAAASVCGTDVHLYDWNPWAQSRVAPPRIVGHEMGGEVIALGPDVPADVAARLTPGTRVAVESHLVCGSCDECRLGLFHVCANTRILGVDVDGVFRAEVAMPVRNAWPVPDGLSAEQAAMMEPFGNAVHACSRQPLAGAVVVVFGAGPIGCAAVAICKAEQAARVIAVDRQPYRLELAERMGADAVVRVTPEGTAETLDREVLRAAGAPISCVLEMSGAPSAVAAATRLVRPGGWISLLGLGDGDTTIDLNRDVVMKGVTMYGIVGRELPTTWERTFGYLTGPAAIDSATLLTHRFGLSEVDGAIELIKSGRCGKVALIPDNS